MRRIAGRPDLMGDRTSLTVYPGMTGMTENAFINVKNRSYTITAPVELKDANTNGVIIAQAGAFGGWVLYMKDGKVHHEYNYFGVERTNIGGQTAVSPGKHEIKYEFIVDAPKPGSGGKCALYVDGQKVAEGRIPKTQPYAFSADEGTDVGVDNETMVSNDYKPGENKFTGKIVKVTIDTKPSNLSAADKKTVEDCRRYRCNDRRLKCGQSFLALLQLLVSARLSHDRLRRRTTVPHLNQQCLIKRKRRAKRPRGWSGFPAANFPWARPLSGEGSQEMPMASNDCSTSASRLR